MHPDSNFYLPVCKHTQQKYASAIPTKQVRWHQSILFNKWKGVHYVNTHLDGMKRIARWQQDTCCKDLWLPAGISSTGGTKPVYLEAGQQQPGCAWLTFYPWKKSPWKKSNWFFEPLLLLEVCQCCHSCLITSLGGLGTRNWFSLEKQAATTSGWSQRPMSCLCTLHRLTARIFHSHYTPFRSVVLLSHQEMQAWEQPVPSPWALQHSCGVFWSIIFDIQAPKMRYFNFMSFS